MDDYFRRLVQAIAGFGVGWLVCFVESMFCGTAFGGPFTVLASFVLNFVFAGIVTGVSLWVGLILLIPRVADVWRRIGYWCLLPSVASVAVMIAASRLGLRTMQTVSGYKSMPLWIWGICMFLIVFPIVNFPKSRFWDA